MKPLTFEQENELRKKAALFDDLRAELVKRIEIGDTFAAYCEVAGDLPAHVREWRSIPTRS